MYVSVSKNATFDPKRQTHFEPRKIPALADFADIITSSPWSPILWKDGHRLKRNFVSCKYATFDFDDGVWTIEMAEAWCRERGFSAIIGTSKSHQIEKNGKPACDRFRLVIPFDEPVISRSHYESIMRGFMTTFAADRSCVDAARFFWPCKKIAARVLGRPMPVPPPEPGADDDYEGRAEVRARLSEEGRTGIWPSFLQRYLAFGAPHGYRHVGCYKLGCHMIWAGFSEDEIVEMCMRTNLGAIGREDVERAVRNGAAAARLEAEGEEEGDA